MTHPYQLTPGGAIVIFNQKLTNSRILILIISDLIAFLRMAQNVIDDRSVLV